MSESADRIYVRGFPATYTLESFKQRFREFGPIHSIYIENSNPEQIFGIVRYKNPNNTTKAIEALNSKQEENITWYIANCQKKSDRKKQTAAKKLANVQKWKTINIHVVGFPAETSEEKLKEHFGVYGNIESVKINDNKGFICFSNEEEAKKAIEAAKEATFEGQKLNVTHWIPKQELSMTIMKNKRKRQMKKALKQRTEEAKSRGEHLGGARRGRGSSGVRGKGEVRGEDCGEESKEIVGAKIEKIEAGTEKLEITPNE